MARERERTVAAVPRPVIGLLVVTLALQIAWRASQPDPTARAEALESPPAAATLRAAAFGEPIAFAQWLTLRLQAFDNQPGISIPFAELDYVRLTAWLEAVLDLDPQAQYPLLLASHVYSQVPDMGKQRAMCDFVRDQFARAPNARWRWLAHCAIVAKHRIGDPRLALAYADAVAREARTASNWARQMRIFILEDLGELEAATVLLGGLLDSGEVTDPNEVHFLTGQLEKLRQKQRVGKSSPPSKSRQPDL